MHRLDTLRSLHLPEVRVLVSGRRIEVSGMEWCYYSVGIIIFHVIPCASGMNHGAVDSMTRLIASGSMSSMQPLVLPLPYFSLTLLAKVNSLKGARKCLISRSSPKFQEKFWSACWSKRQNRDDAEFVNQILVHSEMM